MIEVLTAIPRLRLLTLALSAGTAISAVPVALAQAETAGGVSSVVRQAPKVRLGVYDPHGTFADARNIGIEHVFMPWQEIDWASFRAADSYAASRGRDLLISVEPWSWSGENVLPKEEGAAAIANGRFDAEIKDFCGAAGTLTSPVTIRWGHEMDEMTGRYAWSGLQPDLYIRAYRHFVSQCRSFAPQARFMWSPKGESNLAVFYPGDQYVDLVGISLFALQPYDLHEHGRERTFREAFGEAYDRVAGFGKPVVAAEVGFSGRDGYVDGWAAAATCTGGEFPLLQAIVYFNDVEPHAWPDGYGNPDWRITPDRLERDCREEPLHTASIPAASDLVLRDTAEPLPAPSETEVALASPPEERAPDSAVEASAPEPVVSSYPEIDADDSTPLLAWELAELYGGKSWMWTEGAGYLAKDRRFLAWSGSGETATYAVGRWSVTDSGRMCFKAVWHDKSGTVPSTTCFSHRKIGTTIIQKKEPEGQWYVFRSPEPGAVTESSKLQAGDAVTAKLDEVERSLRATQ